MAKLKRGRRSNESIGYVFIAPWLVGFFFLTLVPTASLLFLGFTHYSILSPPRWIGVQNFVRMFTSDSEYWASVSATLYYAFTSVPLKLAFALAVAMMLNSNRKFLGSYRVAFYIPSILGTSVAIAVTWREIFGGDGLINGIIHGVTGANLSVSWLGDPATAIWTLIILGVWQFGSPMLIFLAGLKQIPTELYECAEIDGARYWKRFFRITLPLLTPVIFFNFVLQMIFGFTAFTQAFVITQGGPLETTEFYALYLFVQAFTELHMGYGAAMAFILLIVVAGFTGIVFKSSPYWVFYQTSEK